MGWMNDIFGGGYDNPADAAQPYLDKIPGYADQAYNPYIQMGQTAGNIAQDQYGQMASDPTAFYNNIYDSYQPSDNYQYQSDQLGKAQSNSAAAGGFSGTNNDQDSQMTTQNALMDQDWNNYLAQVLGIQSGGLQGEQQMYNTGAQASNQWANMMNGYANGSAGNQAMGVQNENQMANSTLGMLGQVGGMTAGYMLGGPVGGAAGGMMMSPSYGSATKSAMPSMMGF